MINSIPGFSLALTVALVSLFSAVASATPIPPPGATPRIVFLGDSLTAGYGLSPEEAYPELIAEKMKADGYRGEVVNAGVSGDTTAGGLRRLDWLLRGPIDVLVLALGANDGLRGVPTTEIKRNLTAIIEKTRAKNPDVRVVLLGMQMPVNMGATFTTQFRELFAAVAREEKTELVPFLLEGVAARPDLNQADGIHPNAKGDQILAENVWPVLRPLLSK